MSLPVEGVSRSKSRQSGRRQSRSRRRTKIIIRRKIR
jgi:hypothetical protein